MGNDLGYDGGDGADGSDRKRGESLCRAVFSLPVHSALPTGDQRSGGGEESFNADGTALLYAAEKFASNSDEMTKITSIMLNDLELLKTDESGYEIKLNRKSGNNYEFMNSGSVVLPNDFTNKIMAFVANPENYIRHILPNGASSVGAMVQENISNVVTNNNTPIEISYNPQYNITGDSSDDIVKKIDEVSRRNIDKVFDRLNTALRKNGMGRKISQML